MSEKKLKMSDYLSPEERKKYFELRIRADKNGKLVAKIKDGRAVIIDSSKFRNQIDEDKKALNTMKKNAVSRRKKELQLLNKVKNAGDDKVNKLRQYLNEI